MDREISELRELREQSPGLWRSAKLTHLCSDKLSILSKACRAGFPFQVVRLLSFSAADRALVRIGKIMLLVGIVAKASAVT